MTAGPRLIPTILFLTLWLIAAATAPAAPIEMSARLSSSSTSVGDPVVLRIEINGSRQVEAPRGLQIEGARVGEPHGSDFFKSATSIVNGRVRETNIEGYVLQYEITPLREGTIVIPPIEITIADAPHQTPELLLRARPPEEDPNIFLRIETDETRFYEGQPIVLRVTMGITRNVSQPRFTLPGIEGIFEVHTVDPPKGRNATDAFSLLGRNVPVLQGTAVVDGVQFSAFTAELTLIPRRPGEFTIGPATVVCEVEVEAARSIFDRPRLRRAVVPSNELTLRVVPLPAEGRPADFTGLVGRYTIASTAEPREAGVGDPIRLSVVVRGDLPGAVPVPDFNAINKPTASFRISSDPPRPQIDRRTARFEREIRALRDDVAAVPPVELHFFNAETGRYETARTDPIPLRIRPTRTFTSATQGVGTVEAPAPAAALTETVGGVRANVVGPAVLIDHRFDLAAALRSPIGLGALVAPPLIYASAAVVLLARRRTARESPARRRARALPRALDTLADPAPDALGRALRSWLADRFDRSPAGLTVGDALELTADLDPALREQLRTLMLRCDAAAYAGSAGDLTEADRAQARDLLRALDRAAKGTGA